MQSWLATVKEQFNYEKRKREADDAAAAIQWRQQQIREERTRPRVRLVGDSRPERRRSVRRGRQDGIGGGRGRVGGRGRGRGQGRSSGRGRGGDGGGGRGSSDERGARTE